MKSNQKSHFFLFFFSLLPGAGEMYMGFMKQGTGLMSLFWGIIFISAWLDLGPILFALPVLWFYSFFHAHNLKKLPPNQLEAIPDELFPGISEWGEVSSLLQHFRTSISILLILIGFSVLWNCLLDILYLILPSFLYDILSHIMHLLPRVATGFLIIGLGLYFIRDRKSDLNHIKTEERSYRP